MKQLRIYAALCLMFLWASCSREEQPADFSAGNTKITFSVAPPEQRGTVSRAFFPLGPETENPIKTLSLLVFDKENLHRIEDPMFYRYETVVADDAPDGKLTVESPPYPEGSNYLEDQKVTLCAVANMSKEDLLKIMREKTEGGEVISLAQFKQLTVELPYHNHKDSVGLVKNIYMFGYYEGMLRPYKRTTPKPEYEGISISLGRIITRLNISVSISEKLEKAGMKYAFRMKNTSRKAYIFPGIYSPKEVSEDKYFFPYPLTTSSTTFYYYVGPHYADSEATATQIEIAYGKDLPENVFTEGDLKTYDATLLSVPICNDPPEVTTDRDFRINRNSVYTISLHLKKKGETSPATRSSSGCYEVEIDAD